MTKSTRQFSRRSANFFATLGYIGICLQWAWLSVTLVIPILATTPLKQLVTPISPTPTLSLPEPALPDFMQIIVMAAAVIFATAVSIYTLLMIPKTVGQIGKRITSSTANNATKRLAKKQTYSPKQQRRIKLRITWAIKILLVVLPFMTLAIPISREIILSQTQVVIVGATLALASLIWFGCQYSIGRLGRVKPDELW